MVHAAPYIVVAIGLSDSADGVVIEIDELFLQSPLVVFMADIQRFRRLPGFLCNSLQQKMLSL